MAVYKEAVAGIAASIRALPQGEIGITGAHIADLKAMTPIFDEVAASGGDMGAALEEAGYSSSDVFNLINDAAKNAAGDDSLTAYFQQLKDDLISSGHLLEGAKEDAEAFKTQMALLEQSEAYLTAFADKFGVTEEEASAALAEMGVSVLELADESKWGALAISAHWKDATGAIIGTLEQARTEFAKLGDEIVSDVGYFKDFEEAVKGSTASLTKKAMAHLKYSIAAGKATGDLVQAGMSMDQINAYKAEGGNELLMKLAKSTPGQMKKLILAYETGLEAVDATILAESAHQYKKGQGMVADLVDGMQTNSAIPANEMQSMMTRLGKGVASGKITRVGMQAATDIANGIRENSDLPIKATDKLIAKVYRDLLSGKSKFESGAEADIEAYVKGLLKGKGLSVTAMDQIIKAVVQKAGMGTATLQGAGQAIVASLATGIRSGAGLAIAAIQGVIADTKAAADRAARNSPEYFTYYMGEKIMSELDGGMRDGANHVGRKPALKLHNIPIDGPTRRGNQALDLEVNVNMDRKTFARQADYAARVGGR
jgi:hypothetical protein